MNESRPIEDYLDELRRESPGDDASRSASSPRSRTTSAKVSGTRGRVTSRLRKRSGGSSNGSDLRGWSPGASPKI
jgi:hypothetical protein